MKNRNTHRPLIFGLFAFLLAGGLWWAFSSSDTPTIDPLTPDIEPVMSEENAPTLSSPKRYTADPRFGIPAAEPEPEQELGTLFVRVIDSQGNVIPKANVGITSPLGRTVFSMRRPDKRHEFHDLNPGTWQVVTYAVSYVDQDLTIEIGPETTELEIQLSDALLLPIRFLTPGGQDAIEVLNSMEDSPLSGFDLYAIATNARPAATLPRMAPGARPQYGAGLFHSASGVVPGESAIRHPGAGYAGVLELKQEPPLFVSSVLRETVLETVEIGASGAREITFTVNPELLLTQLASATVILLDAVSHQPIEDLQVTCEDAHIDGSSQDGRLPGDEGRYTFDQRFPGWATLRAWGADYEVFQTSIQLVAGQAHDLGTIYLEKGTSLTGRVENQAGEGVRSVLYARDDNWSAGEGPPEFGHTLGGSGRGGKLTLNRLGKRIYQVYVIAPGYAPQALALDLTLADPKPVKVVMQPGTKTTLASRYDAEITNRVSIYDSKGTLCFSEYIPGERTRDTWLAPGEYSLVLHHGPREVARRTIEITTESAVHALTQ